MWGVLGCVIKMADSCQWWPAALSLQDLLLWLVFPMELRWDWQSCKLWHGSGWCLTWCPHVRSGGVTSDSLAAKGAADDLVWATSAGFIDLGKRSRVCFGLWLAGLGLQMAMWMVRSQVDPAAKLHLVEWGHVFCLNVFLIDLVLLKDALNGVLCRYLSLVAQIQAWQRKAHLYVPSRMRAAPWTLAHVTTSCVGFCSCRKENTILITPCLSC